MIGKIDLLGKFSVVFIFENYNNDKVQLNCKEWGSRPFGG